MNIHNKAAIYQVKPLVHVPLCEYISIMYINWHARSPEFQVEIFPNSACRCQEVICIHLAIKNYSPFTPI